MTLREFLNAILSIIGASSLTDDEYATVNDELEPNTFTQEIYEALAAVLETRELVTDAQDRLVAYFKARGVNVTQLETAKSQIFLGDVLE